MTWSTIKTEAIVLKSFPFREADRRYRALTPQHGKLEFTGRGAQKGLAKLASHLEPFAIIDLEIVRGKRSSTVISVDRRYGFKKIMRDLDRRVLAKTSLVLVDRYTKEQDPDQVLYQDLIDWLTFLDDDLELSPTRSVFLLGGYLLRFLARLGYKIELSHCLNCKREIVAGDFKWHSGHGGLVCGSCVSEKREDWFAAREVSPEAIKLIRFARDRRHAELLKPALKGEEVEVFAQLVHDLILFHLPTYWETPFWSGILPTEVLAESRESL